MKTEFAVGGRIDTNRNELVDLIIDTLIDEDDKESFISVNYKRPYTVGLLRYMHRGKEYTTMTIAKVCWPDKWDLEKGAILVLRRGARELADRIIDDEMNSFVDVISDAVNDAIEQTISELNKNGDGEYVEIPEHDGADLNVQAN